jgi:ABC-type molybdate transport system substrate-binding protein
VRHFRSGKLTAAPWFLPGISLAAMAALVLLLWHPFGRSALRGDLTLFCAAGLLKPVQYIAEDYQIEYGIKVRIEPDASGTLLSKLRVAPERADLFIAGEEEYVRDARSKKLIAEIFPVARQHLVIAVQKGNPRGITCPEYLLAAALAIPNPDTTAAGRVARRILTDIPVRNPIPELGSPLEFSGPGSPREPDPENLDGRYIWDRLWSRLHDGRSRMSLSGTVTEAAQRVQIGAADAALVWDATARQFGLDVVEVPLFQEKGVEQATLGVSAATPQPTAALHFARYLTARDRGERVFAKDFFQPLDDADVWEDRPALTLMSGAMLKPAIDDLLKRFKQREGVDINTIYAGCGIHVAQMKAMKGGQITSSHFPDAYFSCDVSFMSKVQQWFETSVKISRNDIVLAVRRGNPHKVRSVEDLTRPELRIGLCHPINSALGALCDDLLKKLKLRDRVYAADRPRPIPNPSAGHELVNEMRAGALDLIMVYRSNVLSSEKGTANDLEIVELNLPEAIAIQPFAVAKDSQHKYLMRRLLAAVLSPETQRRFAEVGFTWIAEETSP